jgi:hypothetical protein
VSDSIKTAAWQAPGGIPSGVDLRNVLRAQKREATRQSAALVKQAAAAHLLDEQAIRLKDAASVLRVTCPGPAVARATTRVEVEF